MKAWLKKYDVWKKALAVLIAIVLWVYVVSLNDPVKEVQLKQITPSFAGSEELMTSKNLVVVGNYSVNLEISGKRRELLSLNANDVKVSVDVSKITAAGSYELPYTVALPSGEYKLVKKTPEKLLVKLDEEDTSVVAIKLSVEDLAAEGYVVDMNSVSLSPRELKVSGLQDEIDKIAYAQINVAQKESKTSIHDRMSYNFYNADGKIIELPSVEADYDMVDVSIPILKTKEVPLTLDIQGSDSLKKYINYTLSPATITVAGEENVIEQLSDITVGAVKLSEAVDESVRSFTITLPDGIVNLSGVTTADASIKIDGLSKKTVRTTLIELVNTVNVQSGNRLRPVTTSLDVDILGTEETLSKITGNNVRAIADLQYIVLSRGTHPVDVSIVVDGVPDAVVVNKDNGYTIYVEVS